MKARRGISGDIVPVRPRSWQRPHLPDIDAPLVPRRHVVPPGSLPYVRRHVAPRRPDRPRRRWLEWGSYPVIAVAALAAAYSATAGQVLVAAYAVVALGWIRRSRATFAVALFLVVTIPLFEAIGQSGIAQNAATYVYELLVIGTIQAIIELAKTDKTHS